MGARRRHVAAGVTVRLLTYGGPAGSVAPLPAADRGVTGCYQGASRLALRVPKPLWACSGGSVSGTCQVRPLKPRPHQEPATVRPRTPLGRERVHDR